MIEYSINLQFKQQYQSNELTSMSLTQLNQQAENKQTQIAGFIAKTYSILSDQQNSKIIFWSSSGADFIIKDVRRLEQAVLPKYFRHNRVNSFIRQLNMYGFHKSRKDAARSIFSHPSFIRGRYDLLPSIQRKQRQICAGSRDKPGLIQNNRRVKLNQKKADFVVFSKIQKSLKQDNSMGHLPQRCVPLDFCFSLDPPQLAICELIIHQDSLTDDPLSMQIQIENGYQRGGQYAQIVDPSLFFCSFRENLLT